MFQSISKPLLTTIASVSTLMAFTLATGLVVFSLEVKAEPKLVAAHTEQTSVHAKADRLLITPVTAKGSACSSLGWPHYEQNCKFDMRPSTGEKQKVRIIALR